jgi:hypothetical protein
MCPSSLAFLPAMNVIQPTMRNLSETSSKARGDFRHSFGGGNLTSVVLLTKTVASETVTSRVHYVIALICLEFNQNSTRRLDNCTRCCSGREVDS